MMDYARPPADQDMGHAKVVETRRRSPSSCRRQRRGPETGDRVPRRAWDSNCPQHIPQKFDAADVAGTLTKLQARISELETENASLCGVCRVGDGQPKAERNFRSPGASAGKTRRAVPSG